jgi:hypothetical protein
MVTAATASRPIAFGEMSKIEIGGIRVRIVDHVKRIRVWIERLVVAARNPIKIWI